MPNNPLSSVEPWNTVVEGYVTDTQPLFEKWAEDSFTKIKPKSSDNVIDIACGPGTVSLLLHHKVKSIKALDFSPKMINHFNKVIRERSILNIKTEVCDCQLLKEKSETFDLAFSQFGLMFFPDRVAGFKEMFRVLKTGGKAAIYSWAPVEESTAMQLMIGALQTGFPETIPQNSDNETIVKGLDDIETFKSEMKVAGFKDIYIEPVRHNISVDNPETFWESMVKGSAPLTMMKYKLNPNEWNKKEKIAKDFVLKNINNTKSVYSTAYLAIGKK